MYRIGNMGDIDKVVGCEEARSAEEGLKNGARTKQGRFHDG